jgi:hypothetical protein
MHTSLRCWSGYVTSSSGSEREALLALVYAAGSAATDAADSCGYTLDI